jgi:hypothetical protein
MKEFPREEEQSAFLLAGLGFEMTVAINISRLWHEAPVKLPNDKWQISNGK